MPRSTSAMALFHQSSGNDLVLLFWKIVSVRMGQMSMLIADAGQFIAFPVTLSAEKANSCPIR